MTRVSQTSSKNPRVIRATVLLSGGLDSYTAAAMAKEQGYELYALTILYGQRHGCEIDSARRIAEALGVVEHKVMALDLRAFGGSALTADIGVPKLGDSLEAASVGVDGGAIPVTYVPARNTILLSLALGWAEVLGSYDIFIGANAVDYSGYPDCRPAFIEAFEDLANLATAAGVEGKGRFRIHAPLVDLSKAEIIKRGVELGLDYGLSHSCYDPDSAGRACGRCDSCRLRLKGFKEAGLVDPVAYVG